MSLWDPAYARQGRYPIRMTGFSYSYPKSEASRNIMGPPLPPPPPPPPPPQYNTGCGTYLQPYPPGLPLRSMPLATQMEPPDGYGMVPRLRGTRLISHRRCLMTSTHTNALQPFPYAPSSSSSSSLPVQRVTRNSPYASSSVVTSPAMSTAPMEASTPTPLNNFGNTCYMNATLQCILHSPYLQCRLAQSHSRARGSPAVTALLEFMMPCVANPSRLLITCKNEAAKLNDEFRGNDQSDAHEFLRTFLFVVHNEVNRANSEGVPYEAIQEIENEEEDAAMRRWRKHLLCVDDSVIYDIFGGVVCSRCICSTCHNKSLTFDPFLDLSLPIESGAGHSNTIESLIDVNFNNSVENLMGENQLLCTRCQKPRNGIRSLNIAQWPSILVLHLKRFGRKLKKNEAPVVFPESFVTLGKKQVYYQLYGLVCHTGSENWGHYTSYVCVPSSGWYLCNDATITPVTALEVKRMLKEVYILFYAATS